MKQLRTLVFPMLAAAVLVLSAGSARADMCFGNAGIQGGGNGASDAGADAGDGGQARNNTHPRRAGSAFMVVAALSGVFLFARRKAAGEKK
jgi:hypothetical protein